jgi:hypothetical protein
MSRLRHSLIEISPPPNANRATFHDGCNADGLSFSDLGRHQFDDVSRFGLGITGLIPGAQVNKNVFVGQNHAQLVGVLRAKGSNEFGHEIISFENSYEGVSKCTLTLQLFILGGVPQVRAP